MRTATRKHPDQKLTIRQAFTKYYDTSDLAYATIRRWKHTANCWEKLTDNPPIGKITNETLAEFRAASIEAGHAPATTNGMWTYIRSVLRRLSKAETGNPQGRGIIDGVFWMKPVHGARRLPYRIPLADLDAFYIAAKMAKLPSHNPAAWYRGLLVVCYFTGLRRSDLFSMRVEDVDLKAQTFQLCAQKTKKDMVLPLHDCACEHIEQLLYPGEEYVFHRYALRNGGKFNRWWREICVYAHIEHPFTLHDIRRTAASEIERAQPGMAEVLLQHRPRSVTQRFYLNQQEELAEALAKMRVPISFKHGVVMQQRAFAKQTERRMRMRPEEFIPPKHEPGDWQFAPGQFCYRGIWFSGPGGATLRLLKAIAVSDRPVTCHELTAQLYPGREKDGWKGFKPVHRDMSNLRRILRTCFGLVDNWNPVPCVEYGRGGAWTLNIPQHVGREALKVS